MKILVTGVRGQLGHDLMQLLKARGIDCLGADMQEFDITDLEGTERFLMAYRPDAVIHCAAYTAVDRAEEDAATCQRVNVEGTRNIAKVCKKMDAAMMYISTEYVFSGEGEGFYEPEDLPGPLSQYGRTKLAGEYAVKEELSLEKSWKEECQVEKKSKEGFAKYFIVRISWAFGKNGNNFVKTMLRLGAQREEIRVVCDQIGSPTYTHDLAPLLCDMVLSGKYGTYHATNEGTCSWAEFAEEIFRAAGMQTKVVPITASEYPTAAERPKNSRLSKKCLDEAGFARLPHWKDAISRYLKELEEEKEC